MAIASYVPVIAWLFIDVFRGGKVTILYKYSSVSYGVGVCVQLRGG
jgi:hypothetical protein